MAIHTGCNVAPGRANTVFSTALNVSDVTAAHLMLHGDKETVFSDEHYQGVRSGLESPGSTAI
jgi:IS5 family transposase